MTHNELSKLIRSPELSIEPNQTKQTYPGTGVRLCATLGDYNECQQMSAVTNGTLTCVKARDR